MQDLLFKDEVYAIAGAAMEVHRTLGHGFLEAVYQEALEIEFAARGIPYEPQKALEIRYKERLLNKKYIADFVCYGEIIVELKALESTTGKDQGQVINELKCSGKRVGLLLNFGKSGKLDWQRLVL